MYTTGRELVFSLHCNLHKVTPRRQATNQQVTTTLHVFQWTESCQKNGRCYFQSGKRQTNVPHICGMERIGHARRNVKFSRTQITRAAIFHWVALSAPTCFVLHRSLVNKEIISHLHEDQQQANNPDKWRDCILTAQTSTILMQLSINQRSFKWPGPNTGNHRLSEPPVLKQSRVCS